MPRAMATMFLSGVAALGGCGVDRPPSPDLPPELPQPDVSADSQPAPPTVNLPDAESPTLADAEAPGRSSVFDCDGEISFTVRTGPGEVALWAPAALGGRYIILAATPAASGARYASEDVVYWNRGELATFEIGGQRFVDCRSNPSKVPWADAARRGAQFRALGNEPAWNVEVHEDRFVIVTELGARRSEIPDTTAETIGGTTTWRGASAFPVLRVDRNPCADTMSGEVFEATATLTLEDRVLYGCGRFF